MTSTSFFKTQPQIKARVQIEEGGYELYYEVHGSGPERVFCIMGLMTSLGGWAATVDHFLETFKNDKKGWRNA